MSSTTVSINCPKCKKLIAQSLAPLISGTFLRCPECGAVHKFMGEGLRKPQLLVDAYGKLRLK